MMEIGFFTQLFQQFIALLSAFCIVPAPVPRFEAVDAARSGVVAEAAAPAIADPRAPLVVRVIQTQITGAVSIGEALANSADRVTLSVVAVPGTLASALDSGGAAALPGGVATAAGDIVTALENSSNQLIGEISRAILAQLALLGGGIGGPPETFVEAPAPTLPGPVELIVRFPLAVGVAGAGLLGTAAQATVIVTGAVVTAVTDIVEAAIPAPPRPDETERVSAALEERRLTLPEAIAQAPRTISAGVTRAGGVVEEGVQRAGTDFRNTLLGTRPPAEFATVSASGGAEVRAGSTAGDDTTGARLPEVTRPTRPRPVLGAVTAATGTLKAVRPGVRTVLGLAPRKPGPAPQSAGADEKVDAATG